ncbi:hypothetical protein HJG45_24410 [Roseicella sp. DB1501]|uniref:Uncharacterized protein n=1 Tax=Roseicella aquatilis TaxID=2527868 RepID=A0A4R4D6G9_9PROT|nr:hypothetical protein [Roseicella sp. DB1501]TCZ55782.1 hypothetical protein EXY23_20855 [Roseicella aquatilis]
MLPPMGRQRRDEELSRIAEVVRQGGGRSPLYRWLHNRHDAFAELLAEVRPEWRALAAEFAAMGLSGGDGRAVSPEAARHTWWRVRRDVAKAQAKRRPAVPPVVTTVHRPPGPASGLLPAASSPPDTGDAMARLRAEMAQRSGRG